jgi:glycine dehydrogenase subunit 1
MNFVPHTEAEWTEMLSDIGVKNLDELIQTLPELKSELKIPAGLSEVEMLRHMHLLASKNQAAPRLLSFLGAGAYEHYSPSAIATLMNRGEFLTSYTPYQPEVSQGTLQSLYEFQSMICELMAMDVCNAGMYEGASALAEAVLLALRETGRKEVLIPQSLHPDYKAVLKTYTGESQVRLIEIPQKDGLLDTAFVSKHLTDQTAAVVVQNPNFFGVVEPVHEIGPMAQAAGALYIACVNPLSLGLLVPPGQYGADIAVAEGQPLGIPMGYGGPLAGLFTCKSKWLRKMPGRLVGQTTDVDGKRAFVLTLQAREQHIRREKATSNVCTTSALIANGTAFYLALLGRQGLRDVASQNLAKSHYACQQWTQVPGVRAVFSAPFFNEFVLQTKMPAEELQQALLRQNIVGGLPIEKWFPELGHASLWCVTETKTKEDIDQAAKVLRGILK